MTAINERKECSCGRSSVPKAFPSILTFLLVLCIAAQCRADDPVAALSAKLRPIPVCATISAATATNHIPLYGIGASLTNRVLQPGDTMTVLGTVFVKKKESQWVLYVESQKPTSTTNPPPLVLNMFGSPIKFESKPVPAKLRMLGPFAVSDNSKDTKEQTAQLELNESFLSLGLEQAAEVMHDRNVMTNSTREARDIMKAKLTPQEQRALAGAIPALTSYFEIVQHTEGLESLLYKVVKLPSVWSMVRRFGVTVEFNVLPDPSPANPADWALPPGTPVYYLHCMLSLNKQPALKVTLVVTNPDPPRLICAGVVGLLAEKPGDEETYMTLRLVSAKCKLQR
jgi:hypothetical protein